MRNKAMEVARLLMHSPASTDSHELKHDPPPPPPRAGAILLLPKEVHSSHKPSVWLADVEAELWPAGASF